MLGAMRKSNESRIAGMRLLDWNIEETDEEEEGRSKSGFLGGGGMSTSSEAAIHGGAITRQLGSFNWARGADEPNGLFRLEDFFRG